MIKIIIALALFWSSVLFSQVKVTGKVVNHENHPIEFAEVLLISKDSVAIKSELTNIDGEFTLLIEKGDYLLRVRQLGVILWKQKINITENLDLGVVRVTEKEEKLMEVVVSSQKELIEHKVDRLVFNVDKSIAATGGDAIDALKVTPGLHIQNDQITMIGRSSMAVMIDDKLIELSGDDLINLLRTIRSDNIKSIEVITAPPAKYDAEGNSGIVNIILKKTNKDSWNGSVNSAYKQSTYATGTLSGTFNYQKNRFSFYNNLNYTNGSVKKTERNEIYYPNQIWINNLNKYVYVNNLSGRLGLDYKLSSKWSSGIQYLGSMSTPKTNEYGKGIVTNNITSQIDSLINTLSSSKKQSGSHSLNWHNIVELDTLGKKISTDLDYFVYSIENNRDFSTQNFYATFQQTPFLFLATNSIGNQNITNYSGKIDIEYPLKWANLSYGAKVNFTETVSDIKYYDTTFEFPILNINQSNIFNFRENTQALYFSGTKKLSKDILEVQLGIRIENTQTKGVSQTLNQTNTNNYLQFFPTAYFVYKQNINHTFSLDYSRRLQRPNYSDLNPFIYYSSKYSYAVGNPYLLPQLNNSIELKHSYKDFLFTSLYYGLESQGIGDVPAIDINTKTLSFTKSNYFKQSSFGLTESYAFNKLVWWESSNQVDIYYSISKFKKELNLKETASFYLGFSTNNTFVLNKSKKLKGGINYFYTAPRYDLLYKNNSNSSLDLSLKFSFLQNNLQMAFVAEDIFKTNKFYGTTYTNGIEQIVSSYGDRRFFRLSLSYKLGSKKVNIEKRNFGSEDENGRL